MNIFLDPSIAGKYDGFYETDAGIAIDNLEKAAFLKYLEKLPRVPILELGCGTGQWTEFFSGLGFTVTAVDISDEMLSIAKAKNIIGASFSKADALSLPFDDNSFELVVSVTMLEFTDSLEKAMSEIYRVLKPGGWLLLGCLNAKSELGRQKNNDEILKHARLFNIDELIKNLAQFGKPEFDRCVYLSPSFELLDGQPGQNSFEAAFITAFVQKKV